MTLEPCPFCGGTMLVTWQPDGHQWLVQCHCSARGPAAYERVYAEDRWNTRHELPVTTPDNPTLTTLAKYNEEELHVEPVVEPVCQSCQEIAAWLSDRDAPCPAGVSLSKHIADLFTNVVGMAIHRMRLTDG